MAKNHTAVIKLKGGMGNQMFQYAFGRALEESAKSTGNALTLLFDITSYTEPTKGDTPRPYYLDLLHTNARIADEDTVKKVRAPYGPMSEIVRRVLYRCGFSNTVAFDPSLLQPPYKQYYEGYWQSEKYFLPIAEQLRKEYTLRKPFGAAAQNMYDRIGSDRNAVSIFYRRTDYIGHAQFDIGEQEYQKRALVHMRERVPEMRLYVMSDDIEWVKNNAELPAGSVFVSSKDIPPQEEMQLAAACRHHIIPNSTFAWWSAWLNPRPDKIVIAPKNWTCDQRDTYRDIAPDNWVRV